MKKLISCEECLISLVDDYKCHLLIDIKNQDGLIKPSSDVIQLCHIAEKTFIIYITNAISSKINSVNQLI